MRKWGVILGVAGLIFLSDMEMVTNFISFEKGILVKIYNIREF